MFYVYPVLREQRLTVFKSVSKEKFKLEPTDEQQNVTEIVKFLLNVNENSEEQRGSIGKTENHRKCKIKL